MGAIIGGFLFGWIADHFGRMPACIVCNLVGFFGGAATLFVQNFWQFALSRFVVGFAYDNCYMMIYIIGNENDIDHKLLILTIFLIFLLSS